VYIIGPQGSPNQNVNCLVSGQGESWANPFVPYLVACYEYEKGRGTIKEEITDSMLRFGI